MNEDSLTISNSNSHYNPVNKAKANNNGALQYERNMAQNSFTPQHLHEEPFQEFQNIQNDRSRQLQADSRANFQILTSTDAARDNLTSTNHIASSNHVSIIMITSQNHEIISTGVTPKSNVNGVTVGVRASAVGFSQKLDQHRFTSEERKENENLEKNARLFDNRFKSDSIITEEHLQSPLLVITPKDANQQIFTIHTKKKSKISTFQQNSQQKINHLLRSNNQSMSPNQNDQNGYLNDETSNNRNSQTVNQPHDHKRKNSNTNYQNFALASIQSSYNIDPKQLPPLDPKTSQSSFATQIYQKTTKKLQSKLNQDSLQQSNFSPNNNDLSTPSQNFKLMNNRKEFASSQISQKTNSNNAGQHSQVYSTNQQKLAVNSFVEKNPSTNIITAFSVDREKPLTSQAAIRQGNPTQSLSKILIEHQNLKSQNKRGIKSNSPYNVNQTAELLSLNDKGNLVSLNKKQKKLKQVLKSYQSPQNLSNQRKPDNQTTPFSIEQIGYSIGGEEQRKSNNPRVAQTETKSPSVINKIKVMHQSNSIETPLYQKFIAEHRAQSLERQRDMNHSQQIKKNQDQIIIIKNETSNYNRKNSRNSKIRKSAAKKQNDYLKLNLSGLQKQSIDNNQSLEPQTKTSKSTKNGAKIKKILTLQSKEQTSTKNSQQQSNHYISYGQHYIITTDDRRLQKYSSNNNIPNSVDTFQNYTSARVISTSKNAAQNDKQTLFKVNSNKNIISTQISSTKQLLIQNQDDEFYMKLLKQLKEETSKTTIKNIVVKLKKHFKDKKSSVLSELIEQLASGFQRTIDKQNSTIEKLQSISLTNTGPGDSQSTALIQKLQFRIQQQDEENTGLKNSLKNADLIIQSQAQQLKDLNEKSASNKRSNSPLQVDLKDIKPLMKEIEKLKVSNQSKDIEIKRLKTELKSYQQREQDYQSVLKNTSEVPKNVIENHIIKSKQFEQSQIEKDNSANQNEKLSQNPNKTQVVKIPKLNLLQTQNNQKALKSDNLNSHENANKDTSNTLRETQEVKLINQNNDPILIQDSILIDSDPDNFDSTTKSYQIEQKVVVPKVQLKQLTLNMDKVAEQNENIKKMKKIKGFQDEFMDKYEEFSQSWRDAIIREKRF